MFWDCDLVALEMGGNWARLSLLSLTMFENVFADRQVTYGGDEALEPYFSDEEIQEMLAEWVLTSDWEIVFSYFVDDPQTRRLARGAYPVKNGADIQRICSAQNTTGMCSYCVASQSNCVAKMTVYFVPIFSNLLCVIVTWHVCLKWTWWPVIFLWCLLYSSRQAETDLVGDVVCFLAKLIADPVLT